MAAQGQGVYLVKIALHVEATSKQDALDQVDVALRDGPVVIRQGGRTFEVGYINVPLDDDEIDGPVYDFIRR